MSLLRWPRRSLLYVKEVQAERHELARKAEAQPAFYKSSEASSQGIGTSGNYRENGREFRYQI